MCVRVCAPVCPRVYPRVCPCVSVYLCLSVCVYLCPCVCIRVCTQLKATVATAPVSGTVVKDTIKPTVATSVLDLGASTFTLTFSEVVQADKFNISFLTIQSKKNGSDTTAVTRKLSPPTRVSGRGDQRAQPAFPLVVCWICTIIRLSVIVVNRTEAVMQ
eukprot:scpid105822/ scgid2628/ 